MAQIVLGIGTTHGPLLFFPPDKWDIRADFDRAQTNLAYRDSRYSFDDLVKLRAAERGYFESQNKLEVRVERFDACQRRLDQLGQIVQDTETDVYVIIGDDQHEWFFGETQPAFLVYCGETVQNLAVTDKEEAAKPGARMRQSTYRPDQDETYPVDAALARRIIDQTMDDEFDVSVSMDQPRDGNGLRSLGHAYGFVYRRLFRDQPRVMVPILINTFYPPNQPTPKRCFEFGQSIGRAILSWPEDMRVTVIASGGMSHFVVDEEWDRRMIDALMASDHETLKAEPNIHFQSGNSEVKNWITVAGILSQTELRMNLLEYVPCYRSEAGTGSGMAFATWT